MTQDDTSQLSRSELLGHILSKSSDMSRDEPIIAQNIFEQLKHMGLSTWSLSVIRRLRDGIHKISPSHILEVGGGIGHRSAWLMDLFTNNQLPERYDIVEQGNKFAVILHRLSTRYEAADWCNIVVGELPQLYSETIAWNKVNITNNPDAQPPLAEKYQTIIIDTTLENIAEYTDLGLHLLDENGVLFTTEPLVPSGEVDENDSKKQAEVDGFNRWIDLIKKSNNDYHIAFAPLFEGTIVAFLKK